MDHALEHIKCKGSGYQYIFQNETRRYHSPYIALNSCGKSMLISSLLDDESTFTVHTIEVQSASEENLDIMIIGYKLNVKLFVEKSTLVQLDWANIDLLTFESANDDEEKKRFHFILISIEIT
jgi:hypothetical protein